MKHASVFALVVASALAAGCASARAQDEGGGNPPPPAPEGRGPGPDVRRGPPLEEVQARLVAARARLQDAEARVAQLKEVEKRPDTDPEVQRAFEMLERARAEAAHVRGPMAGGGWRGREPGPDGRGPGGPGGREPGGPNSHEGRKYLRSDFGDGRNPLSRGGPGTDGPRPSLEQRLEQLERAVREMHAMFERHNLPPEARERAEREMRERRAGPRPDERGHPGGPGQPQGPGRRDGPMGPGGPGDAGGPDRPPRPPMRAPRADGPADDRRGPDGSAPDEVRKQLDGARAEIDALRRQLEETRAAMEKMRAELEQLREKK